MTGLNGLSGSIEKPSRRLTRGEIIDAKSTRTNPEVKVTDANLLSSTL